MPDDAHCLARYAALRDAEAFSTLVERHAGMVYAACMRVCRNRADAEDAVQVAFLTLARDAGRIRSSLPAWLHVVATNAALRLRSRRRHAPLDQVPEPIAPSESEAWHEALPRIDEAMAELDDELRTVLVLRHLEGMSQAEIAEQLGMSQPTVCRRLAEGVAELRRRLRWAGEAGALAVALDGARVPAPPAVVVKLGHISLAGPGAAKGASVPTMIKAALVMLALALGIVAFSLRAMPPAPQRPLPAAPRAVAADPPAPAPPGDDESKRREAVLARHVTITARVLRLDRVANVLNDQLRSQDGEWLQILPSADGVEVAVDLSLADAPLRAVLEEIRKQSGYRWRAVGGYVLLDHAMDSAERSRSLDALRQWEQTLDGSTSGSVPGAELDGLIRSGDAESCADVLRLLGHEWPDQAGAKAERFQWVILHALGPLTTNLFPWDPAARPLVALAKEEGVHLAVAQAWERTCARRTGLTPTLCALVGMLGISEAIPHLTELAGRPDALCADLARSGRLQAIALERIRQSAIWALGELHATSAAPILEAKLRAEPLGPAGPAIVGALGRMGDRGLVDLICARQGEWPVWEPSAYDYCALARIDPSALMRMLPPNRPLPRKPAMGYPIPSGWWDGFIVQPCPEILPQVLSLPHPEQGQWWVRNAIRYGIPRLGAEVAIPAVRARVEQAHDDSDRSFFLSLLARLGDREALRDSVRLAVAMNGRSPCQDLSLVMATLPEGEATQALQPMSDAMDPDHPNPGYLACVEAVHGPRLRQALRGRTYTGSDLGNVARFLANDPESVDAWLTPMIGGETGMTILSALDDGLPGRAARAAAAERIQQDDPFAESAIPKLLASPHGSDTVLACLQKLEALPIERVDAKLVTALSQACILPQPHFHSRLRLGRLMLRWMTASADPETRAAAAAWLGARIVVICGPPCAEALAALSERCEKDEDAQVREAARKALRAHLGMAAFHADDGETDDQARMLSGAFDDRAALKRVDAMVEDIRKAIAATPPAPTPTSKEADF